MEDLTTVDDVKRVTRITNELTDDEIGSAISSVSKEIYSEYGWPISSTQSVIDKDNETYYIYPQLKQGMPIYSVSRILVNGSFLSTGSYTSDTSNATVTLDSDIVNNYANETIIIGYAPYIFNRLATFMASLDILQSTHLIAREGEEFPRTSYLTQKIKEIKNKLNEGMYRSSEYEGYNHYAGEYVYQDDIGGIL